MDDTQNPSLNPSGDIASFPPPAQQGGSQPVVPQSVQQAPIAQAPAAPPVVPAQPVQPFNSAPVPQPIEPIVSETDQQQGDQLPFSEKKLSLDDLYGPSTDTPPAQPITSPVPPQPAVEVPSAPVIAQPSSVIANEVKQSPPFDPTQGQGPTPQQEIASSQVFDSDAQTEPAPRNDVPVQAQVEQAQPEEVIASPRRAPDVTGVGLYTTPSSVASSDGDSGTLPPSGDTGEEKGGFHVSQILKFVLGGLVILLVILFGISLISSFFKPQTNGKVTLTYWGLWEDSNVMQGVISDFERDHPNISVNYIKEDPKDYPQRLVTRITNGNGPDIFRFHNSWITPLKSLLLPLPSSVVDSTQLQKTYYPAVGQDLVKNGAVYGVPLEMDSLSLFVNKDIFDHAGAKVPTTWDQFVTVAKALTVKDPSGKIKTSGAAMGTYGNVTHAPDIVSLLMLQNGADLTKLDKSQNANDAMVFYTSFAKGDNNVWDSTLDDSLLAFERGEAAMYFGYSWDILAIKATSPQLNFAVYPVPHLPNRNMTVASYWVEGVSNKSAHQKEALEFMQYLAQKETVTKLYTAEAKSRQFGELYARPDLADSIKTDPLLSPFVSQSQNAVSTFFIGETNYDDFNGRLNQYLANAINSMLTDTSVETAMQTLSDGVSQVLGQYAQKSP